MTSTHRAWSMRGTRVDAHVAIVALLFMTPGLSRQYRADRLANTLCYIAGEHVEAKECLEDAPTHKLVMPFRPMGLLGTAAGDDVLCWSRGSHLWAWRIGTQSARSFADLDGRLHVYGARRYADIWTIFGRKCDDASDAAYHSDSKKPVCSASDGVVYTSVDGGRSWFLLATLKGRVPRDMFIDESGCVSALTCSGEIFRGQYTGQQHEIAMAPLYSPSIEESPFNADWVLAFNFIDKSYTRILAGNHHGRLWWCESVSDGREWRREPWLSGPRWEYLHRTKAGAWLKTTDGPNVLIWTEHDFAILERLPSSPSLARVDANGELLVVLEEGGVLSVSAKNKDHVVELIADWKLPE